MADDRLATLRAAYAERLRELAHVTHAPITRAFVAVPRERFLGPGPWLVPAVGGGDTLTADADPAHIYKNVLVSLDREKRLNNGEPGYYTALLAEMVGPSGQVTGIEYEPDLAAKARANLAPWPNVELLAGDGMALAKGEADIVMASCGVDQVPLGWVRLLRDGGRLFVPLTATLPQWPGGGGGLNLVITRRGGAYAAAWAGSVGIYNCMSGRTEEASERLRRAYRFPPDPAGWRDWAHPRIASLRLSGAPDETCWLAGDGWWLSTEAP